jgi:hypothetical protein
MPDVGMPVATYQRVFRSFRCRRTWLQGDRHDSLRRVQAEALERRKPLVGVIQTMTTEHLGRGTPIQNYSTTEIGYSASSLNTLKALR